MPPPSYSGRRGSGDYNDPSAESSPSNEVRILDILSREDGEVPLTALYGRSGLTSHWFRFWLNELQERGAIETESRKDDVYVALKGKMGHGT